MSDTPYEDTDQRLGGWDTQDSPREGEDCFETAMALKYPLRDDFDQPLSWED